MPARWDLADNNSFEQWQDEGAKTAAHRANERWKQLLADYNAPELDDAIDAEMVAFIDARKAEMPDEIG